MYIIVVDDEKIICDGTVKMLQGIRPDARVEGFTDAAEALERLRAEECGAAFLDVQMPGINGVELARRIKILQPRCNIVFITAYEQYQRDAWEMHASGYVLKPVTPERLRSELEALRFRPEGEISFFVRTFGSFEAFYNGRPLNFRYPRTRELFACLIDRGGAMVRNRELIAELRSGEELRESDFKRLRQDLQDTLRSIGREDILVRQWGGLAVVPQRIPCDLYAWERGAAAGINAFRGEYMSQYAWAQRTLRRLSARGQDR